MLCGAPAPAVSHNWPVKCQLAQSIKINYCRSLSGICMSQLWKSFLRLKQLSLAYPLLRSWTDVAMGDLSSGQDYGSLPIYLYIFGLCPIKCAGRSESKTATLVSLTEQVVVAHTFNPRHTVCYINQVVVVHAFNPSTREEYKMGGESSQVQSHSEDSWKQDHLFRLR